MIPDALADQDVLAFAAGEGRVFLSHDVTTMPGHFVRLEEHESPGIILVRQDRSIRLIMDGIYLVRSQWTPEDLRNSMRWLPR